ncbi:MAG: permease-like cell division protein FtsX [Endomicrobiales bacterium]|jgi:cell division protein FtsX
MKYANPLQQYISVMAVVMAVLVLCCLGLNVCHQSKLQAHLLAARATVAVFLSPDATLETVTSRLMATGYISRIDFFSKETIYEKMSGSGSPIKEMLVAGENPFSPYCLVYLKNATVEDAKTIADAALKIDGVRDARFDEELFALTQRLGSLRRFYQTSLLMVFVVLSLVAGFRLTTRMTARKFDYRLIGILVLSGICAAVVAIASYDLLVRYCAVEPIGRLPLKYLLTIFPGGMLLSVVVGMKR